MSFSSRGSQVLADDLKRICSSVFLADAIEDLRVYFPDHFTKLEKAVKGQSKSKELAALLKNASTG